MDIDMLSSILFFPQPDPLLRSSEYRHLLLRELAINQVALEVKLPVVYRFDTAYRDWNMPYLIYRMKEMPNVLIREVIPKYGYIRNWLGHFPITTSVALIQLTDPKFTSTTENDLLERLLVAQWQLCEKIMFEIKELLDIPIIFIYVRRWDDSPSLEQVVLAPLPNNVDAISCHINDLPQIPTLLNDAMAKSGALEEIYSHTSTFIGNPILPINYIGIGRDASFGYVKYLGAWFASQTKKFTIWLDGGKWSMRGKNFYVDTNDSSSIVRYKDMTIAVPEADYDHKDVIAAFYAYIEHDNTAFSSFESWNGTVSIAEYQANLTSNWRVSETIETKMGENEIQDTIDRLLKKASDVS